MKPVRPAGFTLIEVIVAIVLSAVAMAAILPFLGNVFLQSHEPRTQLDAGLALQTAMERIVVRFATNDLATLRAQVVSEVAGYPGPIGVTTNAYIQFDAGGQEIAAGGSNTLLKIALQNALGETVTRIFAEPP